MQPIRSAIYVPADNPRAVAKARSLACDAVIFDLEDAVAPAAKESARAAVANAMSSLNGAVRIVRVNALCAAEGVEDIAAVRVAQPDAVLFPKIANAREAQRAVAVADPLPAWAMIETPGAVIAAAEIASAGVVGLVGGWNDLALSCGLTVSPDRRELWAAMSAVVLAARAHGIIALDGVPLALRDADATIAEAKQARGWGFDGKTLVHPDQIAPCHAGFASTETERAAAEALLEAWEMRAPGTGVIAFDGRMVEALHAEAAQRMLARGG